MIIVDSSVWIDYFNGEITIETEKLDGLLQEEHVVIADLILTEILQGFRNDRDFAMALELLSALDTVNMLGWRQAVRSAENYRFLRKKGVTVRKTVDTIIATYCIENNHSLLYADRDFDPFVEFLGLRVER